MKRTARLLVFAMLCAVSALPWGWAQPSASAQMVPRTGERATLSIFTGELYGVQIPYSSPWEEAGSGVIDDVDFLNLDNGVSVVNFSIGPGPDDLVDCVDKAATIVRDTQVSDLEFSAAVTDTDTEYGALFTALDGDLSMVASCHEFGHPDAKLLFIWVVPSDDLRSQVPVLDELWQGIAI